MIKSIWSYGVHVPPVYSYKKQPVENYKCTIEIIEHNDRCTVVREERRYKKTP